MTEPLVLEGPKSAGGTTVFSLFRQRAEHRPDALGLVGDGVRWTYGELLADVERLAALLVSHGVGRGDRVAIVSENRPEYPRLHLAAARIGAIVACQNWRLAPPELRHCITLVEPKLIFASRRFTEAVAQLDLGNVPVIELEAPLPNDLPALPRHIHVEAEDPLVILYTSGTTGLPKGALISHRAEIARMSMVRIDFGVRPGDTVVAWAPMFHMGGTEHALYALMAGDPVIVCDGYDVNAMVEAIKTYRLGWLLLVPGAIEQLLDALEADPRPVQGCRTIGCMADLVPAALVARTTRIFNAPFLNSFGATETGVGPLSGNLIPIGEVPQSLSKALNSLYDFVLLDPEGNEVAPGEIGEGAVRGPTLFSGYYKAPETNTKDFATGYFRMGDLFRRTPDGRYDFVDRAKYMIKSGGENIYPAEIERVLLSDPRCADACVVRKKDAKWGEVPVVFVARHDESLDKKEVEAMCRRELAGYKRPKEVYFIAFDDLPRSTSGKIVRQELEKRLG